MDREYVSRIEPGLRVIVTAGAAGIGKVIVEALHTCGAHIHVCDVDADAVADLNSALPEIGTTIADVADASQVDQFFAEAETHLGGLDVLVNNAGIAGPTESIDAISPEDWERTVAVNLNGHFRSEEHTSELQSQ